MGGREKELKKLDLLKDVESQKSYKLPNMTLGCFVN